MGKFLKPGKVVIVLAGRYAGRKAVIVKAFDSGLSGRKFGHCIVAGIDRYPRKITRSMQKNKKKVAKRSKIKPFVKFINYNHLMPTRYQVDLDLKNVSFTKKLESGAEETQQVTVDESSVSDPTLRRDVRKGCKAAFEEGYFAQNARKNNKSRDGVQYFYKKLRF